MTTLADLEQEIARRCGPFVQATATNNPTLSTIVLGELGSTLDLGDEWTGTGYVLRRGLVADYLGTISVSPVPVVPGDRVRRVAGFETSTGKVTLDRPWSASIYAGTLTEVMELHYLDPARELRVAALAGLGRCFTVDRATVSLVDATAEHDLTVMVPWITTDSQVYEFGWAYPGQVNPPYLVRQWDTFMNAGHVWISTSGVFPNSLVVYARRPASSTLVRTMGVTFNTLTTPVTATAIAHGLATGQVVTLDSSISALTGDWTLTVTGADTFTLDDSVASAMPGSQSSTLTAVLLVGTSVRDLDEIGPSLDYAAAAGHVEAWRRNKAKLTPGAQVGLIPSQAEAALELTRQAAINYAPPARRTMLGENFPRWWGQSA